MNAVLPAVLVVDDDPTARTWMRATLTRARYAVTSAESGEEALALFAAHRFDLVLLDVQLPGIDGYAVCRHMREGDGDGLPIVMVTGADDVESVERAFECGATDFLAKPIHWGLLPHRVRHILAAARAIRDERAGRDRQAAILQALPDAWMRLDRDGVVAECGRGAAITVDLGLAPGQRWLAGIGGEPARVLSASLVAAAGSGRVETFELAWPDQDGTARELEGRMVAIDDREYLCLLRDISDRRRAEAALQRSRLQLAQAHAVARLGHWSLDLIERRLEWSSELRHMLRLDPDVVPGKALLEGLVHPEDLPAARRAWAAGRAGQPFEIEYRAQVAGAAAWLQEQAAPQHDPQGRVVAVVGTVQDITERKLAEERVRRLAYFDALTGLPNRASFVERLTRELRRARAGKRRVAVLFMDLDGFKAVNDTMGHEAGDAVLDQAAERLRAAVRPQDVVARAGSDEHARIELARLGGDEFTALVCDIVQAEDAARVAERIAAQIRRPFFVKGSDWTLSTSIGIAVFPEDGSDALTLLKNADTAMYHAKERGRDGIEFYDAALTARAVARSNLERELRQALERNEFRLVYQPQFDVAGARFGGVEALLRWQHPELGSVSPADFIPAAEASGLIVSIGRWVLRTGCAQAAAWRREGLELRMAVNVSARQLADPRFCDVVQMALAESGLEPSALELELTESTLMEDAARSQGTLQTLRALGVRLALDDFGVGYSSLSYLQRMTFNALKIDRSFVARLPDDRDSAGIVRAVMSIASSLAMEVVAEGVETAAQAQTLQELRCTRLQGFLYARPLPAAEAEAVLRQPQRQPLLRVK